MVMSIEQMNDLIGYQKVVSAYLYLLGLSWQRIVGKMGIIDAMIILEGAEFELNKNLPIEAISITYDGAREKYLL